MKQKIIETIRAVPIAGKTYEEYVEAVAERLIDTILPEGAIILTRAEVEALGKYEKMLKGAEKSRLRKWRNI